MDIDGNFVEPLVQDWLNCLQETTKGYERSVKEGDEFYMPFVAMPEPVIRVIFNIAKHLELGPDTRYIAIHLYDRFICNYFWEIYKNELTYGPKQNSWSQACTKISNQSKLYLMSCLQLASKMDSYSNSLTISQILDALHWLDKKHEYNHTMILSSEFKVFKTVKFKIPLCTPLHCIEVLLVATDLKEQSHMQEISINLLDLAYLQHEKLYFHMQTLIQGHILNSESEHKSFLALKTNLLFLAASIILCSMSLLTFEDEAIKKVVLQLSRLINIKDTDIQDMATILLITTIQE